MERVVYEDGGKRAYFNGLRFTRDDKNGYFLNSTNRVRLHRYVWEYFNGEIPKGFQIHHVDEDKNNNDIDNLQLTTTSNHLRYHASERVKINPVWADRFQSKGTESAKEWHKSKEGIEWHKENYQKIKDKLHKKEQLECVQCGKGFTSIPRNGNSFCSNSCKSKWRRESGLDNEVRKCEICAGEFTVNKYSKTKTCSRSCGSKLIWINHKKNTDKPS